MRKNSTIVRMQPCTTGMSRSGHALDQQRAQTRPGKELLDDHRLSDHRAERSPTVVSTMTRALRTRCQRTTRVSLMPLERAVRTKSAFMISRTAARVSARQQRKRRDAEGHSRQHEVFQVAVAFRSWETAELEREEIHQEQAEQNFAVTGRDGQDHRGEIDGAAGFQRCDETDGTPITMASAIEAKASCRLGHIRTAIIVATAGGF